MSSPGIASLLVKILLAALVLGMAWVAVRRLRRAGGGDWSALWEMLAASLKRGIITFLGTAAAVFAAAIALPLAGLGPTWTVRASQALSVVWIGLGAWALTLLSSVVVCFVQWKYDISTADNLRAREALTRVKVLQRIVVVLIWLGCLAGALLLFERFRMLGGTLLASAGVLSIVLGISAQKTFGAVIAGIQIALSRPINLDDVVIVEGEWGRIEEITFTYVVVKIWDQRRLVVPVTYFLDNPFQNWTKKTSELLGAVTLHVDYSTPLEPLRAELQRLCSEAAPLWDGRTCLLQVVEAGPETMTLRALVSAADASKGWDLRCLVREGLIVFLNRTSPQCLPKRRLVISDTGKKTPSS